MRKDKRIVKEARKTFRSHLKENRIHYRQEKKKLQEALPKQRFIMSESEKKEREEQKKVLKQAFREGKTAAQATFTEEITYVSPRFLKSKEIKKYRLPQTRNRLKAARKRLEEIQLEEKSNPKFAYHKEADTRGAS